MIPAEQLTLNRFCDFGCKYYDLCKYLSDNRNLAVNTLYKSFYKHFEAEDIQQFLTKAEKECDVENVYSMYYYFKLFLSEKDFQNTINTPEFPILVVENFILYLMGYCHDIGEEREVFFDNNINFLTEDKYISLLTESEYLYRDVDFFVYILMKLSHNSVDKILKSGKHIRQVLIDIFLNFPEDRINHILTRNPVIFNYIIDFLLEERMFQEVDYFQTKHTDILKNAQKIQALTRKLLEMNDKGKSLVEINRGERALFIIREIKQTTDLKETFSILEYNNVFIDEFEKLLIYTLLFDQGFHGFFNTI